MKDTITLIVSWKYFKTMKKVASLVRFFGKIPCKLANGVTHMVVYNLKYVDLFK